MKINDFAYYLLKPLLKELLQNFENRRERYNIVKKAVDVNCNENTFFPFLYNMLTVLLKPYRRDISQQLVQRLGESSVVLFAFKELIRLIELEIQEMESSLKKDYIPQPLDLTLNLNPSQKELLIDVLTQWVEDEYAPVDERIERSQHKRVRRLDSLSRVLVSSSKAAFSVCGAVTIDSNVGISQLSRLVYSSNLSNSEEEALQKEINTIINILKNFYTHHSLRKEELPPLAGCKQLIESLYTQLYSSEPYTNSANEPTVLYQAVYKIIHALLYDDVTFTPREKEAFLTQSTHVLLIPGIEAQEVRMQMNFYTPSGRIQLHRPFSHSIEPHERKYIHAEQLLALYLYDACGTSKEYSFTFGISKLCCKDCSHFLEHYPAVLFRGHHQKQYHGVINLETGERSKQFTTRFGPLHPEKSPFKTPSPTAARGSIDREKKLDEAHLSVPSGIHTFFSSSFKVKKALPRVLTFAPNP